MDPVHIDLENNVRVGYPEGLSRSEKKCFFPHCGKNSGPNVLPLYCPKSERSGMYVDGRYNSYLYAPSNLDEGHVPGIWELLDHYSVRVLIDHCGGMRPTQHLDAMVSREFVGQTNEGVDDMPRSRWLTIRYRVPIGMIHDGPNPLSFRLSPLFKSPRVVSLPCEEVRKLPANNGPADAEEEPGVNPLRQGRRRTRQGVSLITFKLLCPHCPTALLQVRKNKVCALQSPVSLVYCQIHGPMLVRELPQNLTGKADRDVLFPPGATQMIFGYVVSYFSPVWEMPDGLTTRAFWACSEKVARDSSALEESVRALESSQSSSSPDEWENMSARGDEVRGTLDNLLAASFAMETHYRGESTGEGALQACPLSEMNPRETMDKDPICLKHSLTMRPDATCTCYSKIPETHPAYCEDKKARGRVPWALLSREGLHASFLDHGDDVSSY